jgi:hypothetical protein
VVPRPVLAIPSDVPRGLEVTERKWPLVKIREGDYLLPSNDRQTLWRIRSYEEDGSAFWEDADGKRHEIRGRFWSTVKYTKGTPDDFADRIDRILTPEALDDLLYDGEIWSEWASGFRTRRDAIEDALE